MDKVFEIHVTQGEYIYMENTSTGDIIFSPGVSGSFFGRETKGELLPLGIGKTFVELPHNGKNIVETEMVLKTEAGEMLFMDLRAFLDLPLDLEAKMMGGEYIDPSQYYFKGVANFKTGEERYKWLERRVCICEIEIKDWMTLVFNVFAI